ncbi:MAG: HAD-IIIA family hydrolase [Candidatus Omnitrophota bacterium]
MENQDIIVERAKKIKLLLLDVDGVLTDGRIIYDSRGADLKFFDVCDGLGINLLKKIGIPTILISAKSSKTIKHRAKDMPVEAIFENASPKVNIYKKILHKYKLNNEEVCFVGDDLVDLAIMRQVGLAVAVRNAAEDVKNISHYVTQNYGGRGAVREVAELIIKAQNKWENLILGYF